MGSLFEYEFMILAFIAVLVISPLFAMLGTVVVENRLAFFSDALGHSALTGIALGILLGVQTPIISMCIFAVMFALMLNKIRRSKVASGDTVISVFSSTAIALGLVLLSMMGGFNKYSSYLIGDILTVGKTDIILLASMLVIVVIFWIFGYNKIIAMTLSESLARSKGIKTGLIDTFYIIILALSVTVAIRWIGILLINSMLVLPAAAARNVSKNIKQYFLLSIVFSLIAGIIGLIFSYYNNITAGPSIVLVSAGIFFITYVLRTVKAKRS